MSRMLNQGCFKKKRYASKADAKARHPSKRAYLCPTCGAYHVRSKVSHRQSGH